MCLQVTWGPGSNTDAGLVGLGAANSCVSNKPQVRPIHWPVDHLCEEQGTELRELAKSHLGR